MSRPARTKSEKDEKKSGGWVKIEKWGRAVHRYKGQPNSKELSFEKGDLFKLFSEAQGWYKAYKLPLDKQEVGMIPGNYVKLIPEPSQQEQEPPKEEKKKEVAAPSAAAQVEDSITRASRRRNMTENELESEKQLKMKLHELENELKNVEFRHRAEISELKAETSKLKSQAKKLEDENTGLENKVLLLESAGGLMGGDNSAEVEQLKTELEELKASRKADLTKVGKQWERKMERAQAEIDELQEQVNKLAKQGGGGSGKGKGGGADEEERLKEAESDNEQLRNEVTRLKEQIGGYLDMIEDLKDELDEAKNGPGSGGGDDELREELNQAKAEEERLRKGEKALLAEIQELEAKEDETINQLNDLMKTNGALLKEVAKLQQKVQEAESELMDKQAQVDELTLKVEEGSAGKGPEKGGASVVELEGRVRGLQAEKESLTETLEQLKTEHEDSQAEIDVIRKEFEGEREQLRARISELEAESDVAKSGLEKAKARLEEKGKGGLAPKSVQKNIAALVEENEELLQHCRTLEEQLDKAEAALDKKNATVKELAKIAEQMCSKVE